MRMLRAEDFESVLRRHVLDAWYPRCLDVEHGGFLCDFDRAWQSCGPQEKLQEFQARQTWMAADAARAYPGEPHWREAAQHGFRFLNDVLWDHEAGGWYHLLDRAGRPLESGTKHTHGFAYAISACVAHYTATGDPAALRLGQEAFAWIDRHAHDARHGGYFGFLRRDGTPILDPAQCPWKSELDTIGTSIGLKDLNVQSDFLEAVAMLYEVWPDPCVGERLHEMIAVVGDRMFHPGLGAMYFYVTPDWRPVPHLSQVGYQCQSAYRLMLAGGVTGGADRTRDIARRLVDNVVRCAFDGNEGGFYYLAPGALPLELEGRDVRVRLKAWWVQAEALRALIMMHGFFPDERRYLPPLEATWRYFERHVTDHRFGGIYTSGLDGVARWQRVLGGRFAPGEVTRKGSRWKDASHEGRALLFCMRSLRGVGF
jgi:mannobiose 2-epimerase